MTAVHVSGRAAFAAPLNLASGECQVLVADDHPAHREIMRAMLVALNCHVTMVENGLEAVEVASRTRFALVVLDRHMPHGGGDVASLLIRSGGASQEAILACYSSDRPSAEVATLYDVVLCKPTTVEVLLDQLSDVERRGAAGPSRVEMREWNSHMLVSPTAHSKGHWRSRGA